MKNKENKKNLVISLILIFISIVYTVLVKLVDVRKIAPNDSSVGFGKLNSFVKNVIGVNMTWYKVTEILGYVALMIAFIYGVIGLVQLIKRKSLFKVDREIILIGVFYIVVI